MKNNYNVKLINIDNCIFDSADFTSLKKARSWASGRGATLKFDKWYDYTVSITKNGLEYKEYKTR